MSGRVTKRFGHSFGGACGLEPREGGGELSKFFGGGLQVKGTNQEEEHKRVCCGGNLRRVSSLGSFEKQR